MEKKKPPLRARAPVTLQLASHEEVVCFDELTNGTNSMEISTQKTDEQTSENEVLLNKDKRNLQKIIDWLSDIQLLSQCLVMCLAQVASFILLVAGLIALWHGDVNLLMSVLALNGFTGGSSSGK